ncbi:MAG TPA: hypothetical protein VMU29_02640 [Smithella sp.]|nr:hypothetical protein [Smithella sp.]
MLDKLYIIAFVTLVVLGGVVIYFHYRFLSILKTAHNEKWKELGCPSLINNSPRNNIATLNFLRKNEYLMMNDQNLTKISLR